MDDLAFHDSQWWIRLAWNGIRLGESWWIHVSNGEDVHKVFNVTVLEYPGMVVVVTRIVGGEIEERFDPLLGKCLALTGCGSLWRGLECDAWRGHVHLCSWLHKNFSRR